MRSLLLSLILSAAAANACALEVVKNEVSTRWSDVDWDIEIKLDRSEVDNLASPETKAFVVSGLTSIVGPEGVVAAKHINDRTQQVKDGAGPNGAWVKMTIRNGNALHVWVIYPL